MMKVKINTGKVTKILMAIVCFAVMNFSASILFAQSSFSVLDFGAVGDGLSLNTEAIQNTIDSCSSSGGGCIYFPPGNFISGTIILKDNVSLHLQKGAVLSGSANIEDYPELKTSYRYYSDEWSTKSLIFAYNVKNISICGEGTIDGQGAAFQSATKKKPERYKNRPYLIRIIECNNVKLSDVRLKNSAMWMQHYLACDNVRISGISVYNHCNKNNDMIDIDGCKNVIISDCIGDTDDDALTFKSTSLRSCENITVTNCILSSHCNAIKFGTETTGGFKNVVLSNCIVKPSEKKSVIYGLPSGISGISLEIVDGGKMDGIDISDVIIDGPEVPIFIRLGNRARKYRSDIDSPEMGSLKNIKIHNILVRNVGKTASSITGIPGFPVENIEISNVSFLSEGAGTKLTSMDSIPELETRYPEATMFGMLPASVFYIRHVKNLSMSHINAEFLNPETRVQVYAEDVEGLNLSDFNVKMDGFAPSLFWLKNCRDVYIFQNNIKFPIKSFLKLEGRKSNNIILRNNVLHEKTRIIDWEKQLFRNTTAKQRKKIINY